MHLALVTVNGTIYLCAECAESAVMSQQPISNLQVCFSKLVFGPIANLKGPYFQRSLSAVSLCVCLSVCLWLALLPFNVNRFWRNLVTRTLLWYSLAATIMVQIGCRGTARRLFENFKKFSKITEFEFQNSCPSFFASVSSVYCKKIWTRF